MPPHLLIVGGGHAAVEVVRRARRWTASGARVTLLSEHPRFYYSGMTPEMLGGVYRPRDAAIDLPALCAASGVSWREGTAVAIDTASRAAVTGEGARLAADLMAINIGSRTRRRESASGAIPTKPLHALEALDRLAQEVVDGAQRRVVIVGGGAAGVEIALNLTARCGPRLRLALIQPGERLLSQMPPGMGRHAAALLAARGVEVRLGATASGADVGGACLEDGTRLAADAVLWATGPAAPGVFREARLPVDNQGYLVVEQTLQVPGHSWLFAAGDCVSIRGMSLPKVGVHAVKQGPVLADNLYKMLRGHASGALPLATDLKRFKAYPLAPLILSTGEREGWLGAPGRRDPFASRVWLRGAWCLWLKHLVDRRWIAKYRVE